MKNFKLFKKLGALLTAVAVLASMGTVAFATETNGTISIGEVTIVPTDVVNGEGVYTITVPYEATNIGPKGVTMLAYAKAKAEAPALQAGADFTEYDSVNYQIAYIAQETPASSISFNIDTTGEKAIEVGAGEKILILLGGDNVAAPASALVGTYWTSTAAAALKATADGSAFAGLGSALTVNLDSTTIEEALKTALAAYTVYVQDENGNSKAVAWSNVDINVEEAEGDGITHKATLTVSKDVEIDGVYNEVDAVYEFNFAADMSWTADTLVIDQSTYAIYKDAIGAKTVEEALKDAILEKTIKVTKTTPALEVVVDTAANASNITVALNAEDAGFTGAENDTEVKFDVTLAAGTYGEATVAEALTATVTVNYQLVTPSAWTVASAEYIGTAIPNIEEAKAADYDFAAYAATQLNGKKVTLKDSGNANTYELTLVSGNEGNFTVSAVAGEPDGSDVATVTVTVTIAAKVWTEGGVTEITIPAEPAITFNTTFTSKMETVKYGDVNEDTFVDMGDAIVIWRKEMGLESLTSKQQKAADVNGDTVVDMGDAILIWQREMGLCPVFPVEQ